jgi:guanylate kinase
MSNIFITISAPSGTGKNTIINKLIAGDDGLVYARSATTRPMRDGESQGAPYHFLEVDDFKRRIRDNDFFEYEEVYENIFYGVLKDEISFIWSQGKHAISDVDVVGALNIKRQMGDAVFAIFVLPPSLEELERRLRSRGNEDEGRIKERLQKAEFEMSKKGQFDVVVVNDDLEKAVQEIRSHIKAYEEKHSA